MDSFLPGAASLEDCIDKKLLVILRDGRNYMEAECETKMTANLVLQDTMERMYHNDTYGEEYRGMFVVRGENVVLLGELDEEREARHLRTLREVPSAEINAIVKKEAEARKQMDLVTGKILHARGFCVDFAETDHY
ncbi:UNVERIFIED_CONTAM: SM-like, degradation of cytoplasmic mRNAs and positively regulates transcription initiation [Siphonaria sp. JEL0065]|nr:SM-like, degradation of cytoplasmic mRNAs and positively regulates transcription initiation [Siphonaria sp. JEL0065]